MPGRYLSDTTARCQTITQTRFFTTYVDSCWTVPGWPIWNPWVIRIGSATVTPVGTAIQAVLPDPSSMFYISRTAVPSAINHVSLLVESVSNPVVISVVETVDGQEVVLAEQLLQAAQMSTVSFSITPSTPSIRIRVRWFTAPAMIRWRTICVQVPQMQSETYLVDVCDEIGDQYRFGFNGQEKVNEMSGIGNHNTAFFGELDTRVARRWNLDPKPNISISSYAVFSNSPILLSDVLLDTPGVNSIKPGGAPDNPKNGQTYSNENGNYEFYSDVETGGAWSEQLDNFNFSSNASTKGSLTSYMNALRNTKWYGGPKEMSKNYSALQKRIADGGYRPYNPEAIGISLNYNFTALPGGYAGSLNLGLVGNEFGLWHTGGANIGTWNASVGLGGFMSDYDGPGMPTIESYMGEGKAYGFSVKTPSLVSLDLGYSVGLDKDRQPIWRTLSGGLSVGNPKLPGSFGVSYQPQTYSHKIINFNEPAQPIK